MKPVTITDAYVIKLIEAEQKRRGDSTRPKTAGRLIVERYQDLESQSHADGILDLRLKRSETAPGSTAGESKHPASAPT